MSWASIAVAAVSIGVSAYEYSSAPKPPGAPNLAAATQAGYDAELATEGDRRGLQSAEEQGTTAQYTVGKHNEKVQMVQPLRLVPGKPTARAPGARTDHWVAMPAVKYDPADWQEGGKYADSSQFKQGQMKMGTVKVPAHLATADFTGLGEADVQSAEAKQNAANMLALEQKYGTQFIDTAKQQQELADPQGTAARKEEYQLLQDQLAQKSNRPVADLLDKQVGEQLASGNKLDNVRQDVLDRAVAEAQAARGNGNADTSGFEDNLETGQAGTARRLAAEGKATGWLSSGATPEDVDYRRQQQNIADLSAFVNGQTPQSQFKSLSGAGAGPAPFNPGQPLPQQNPGAGAAGASFATGAYGTNLGYQASQANSWMAGLSAALSAGSALIKGTGQTTL